MSHARQLGVLSVFHRTVGLEIETAQLCACRIFKSNIWMSLGSPLSLIDASSPPIERAAKRYQSTSASVAPKRVLFRCGLPITLKTCSCSTVDSRCNEPQRPESQWRLVLSTFASTLRATLIAATLHAGAAAFSCRAAARGKRYTCSAPKSV